MGLFLDGTEELFMAPINLICDLFKGLQIMFFGFIAGIILLVGITLYIEYASDKCSTCKTNVEMGEYCRYCGQKMTPETTTNHIWVSPSEMDKTIK